MWQAVSRLATGCVSEPAQGESGLGGWALGSFERMMKRV